MSGGDDYRAALAAIFAAGPDGIDRARKRWLDAAYDLREAAASHAPDAVALASATAAEVSRLDATIFFALSDVRETLARVSTEGGWNRVAHERSALQAIFDLYGDTPAAGALPAADEIADIDAAIRNGAEYDGHLPPDEIPAGMPPSHWWWWAPDDPPGADA